MACGFLVSPHTKGTNLPNFLKVFQPCAFPKSLSREPEHPEGQPRGISQGARVGAQTRAKRTARRGEQRAPRVPAAPALHPLPELQAPTRAGLKPSRVLDSLAVRRAAIPSQAVPAAPTRGSPSPAGSPQQEMS